ncbi:MAG: hypothetical protein JSU63_09015, partial [Phycisphaerales bacterium]
MPTDCHKATSGLRPQRRVKDSGFADWGYLVTVDIDPQDSYAYVWLRYTDANNGERFKITDKGTATL